MATYSFIAEEKAEARSGWSVSEMCRVLEVSRSGFYDWERRGPSDRELSDALLAREIEAIWIASDRTYGVPRMWRWLARQGYRVGHNRVAKIMRDNGWFGETGRRKVRTTIADKKAAPSKDLLKRDFNPLAPDVAWCGDITYIPTGEGWLYLATVIDLFSRRVIGWALAEHMRAGLVGDALSMAMATRGGQAPGVLFHSDRGCQGGFNRSSQHFVMMEVFDGSWRQAVAGGASGIEAAVGGGSGVACADAFAGAA
jgi:transposase InsO family protein